MSESESEHSTAQTIGKVLLTLILIAIAVRMLAGLAILALNITGITIAWLQEGAPLDWFTFRPRDFIIIGIVLIISLLSKRQKSAEPDKEA